MSAENPVVVDVIIDEFADRWRGDAETRVNEVNQLFIALVERGYPPKFVGALSVRAYHAVHSGEVAT